MQLDSYLELFTTMYGWAFANILGEIITGTGLVILPFALIVFNTWREAKEQGMGFHGVMSLLEAVQTKLIVAMFVMSLCFATTPITSLSNITLSYTPTSTSDGSTPQTATLGKTNSGYDTAMADAVSGSFSSSGNLAYVPAWWYSIMAISSGVNTAFRAGLTNAGRDIRMVEDLARTATIEDPALLHDIQRFYSECFTPARSQYLAMDKSAISAPGQAILAESNADYGPTDVDWIGSQFFRTEYGFYGQNRSFNPVPGFAIDFSRDTDYIQTPATEGPEAGYVNPDWGRPTCKQWWETSSSGLRDRMISNTSTWQNLLTQTSNTLTFTSDDKAKDEVAKLAQTKANPQFVDSEKIMGNNADTLTQLGRMVTGGLSTLGTGAAALVASVAMTPIITALPMMQALVLMGIYMFLPLIVFLSGYDLKMMFYGAMAIFTVKFWVVMWYVAEWVDSHLIASMYPGTQGNIIMQELTQMASGVVPVSYKRMILNTLLLGMFIFLPFIWSAMMAWAGVQIGRELTGMQQKSFDGAKQSAGTSTAMVSGGKIK